MTGVRGVRTNAHRRLVALAGALLLVAACSSPSASTAPSSGAESSSASPSATILIPTAGPTLTPLSSPTAAPVAAKSEFGTTLQVQVNRLAARLAPDTSAALVHAYNLSGPAPVDAGQVRLSKGDFVSVELGPLKIGNTVWYLVWPSKAGKFRVSDVDWYDKAPPGGTPGPGWVAASVGTAVYMTPSRHPATAELEALEPVGLTGYGTGAYVLGTGAKARRVPARMGRGGAHARDEVRDDGRARAG